MIIKNLHQLSAWMDNPEGNITRMEINLNEAYRLRDLLYKWSDSIFDIKMKNLSPDQVKELKRELGFAFSRSLKLKS